MPTESTGPVLLSPPLDAQFQRFNHASCPPEEERHIARLSPLDHDILDNATQEPVPAQQPSPPPEESCVGSPDSRDGDDNTPRPMDIDGVGLVRDLSTPTSSIEEGREATPRPAHINASYIPLSASPPSMGMDSELSNTGRLQASSISSFLRPGSKFCGTQQSDRQVYDVQVEIKHVDMNESFICGFLRIQGLTHEHPTLTTYFEGEIVGTKYTFHTKHAEWGSNEKVDMQHWARFPAWRPLAKAARQPNYTYKGFAQKEHLFMRWKEYFLVPDYRVQTISGASFEGFYYICFNQCTGTVSGIYFHSKSEKYQQLELTHVDDRGCMGAMEFR